MMELPLDGLDVFKDIGVIKFQIIQDQGMGAVMDELGALVEKGAVVLVCFDYKKVAVAQTRRHGKVPGNTANQVSRFKPGLIQDP